MATITTNDGTEVIVGPRFMRIGAEDAEAAQAAAEAAQTAAEAAQTGAETAETNAGTSATAAASSASSAAASATAAASSATSAAASKTAAEAAQTAAETAETNATAIVNNTLLIADVFSDYTVQTSDGNSVIVLHSDQAINLTLSTTAEPITAGQFIEVHTVGDGPFLLSGDAGQVRSVDGAYIAPNGFAKLRSLTGYTYAAHGDLIDAAAAVPSEDFDFYVDSVSGNDANDGTTAALAFETLAAAQTAVVAAGNNTSLGLARGSTWRDKLDFDTSNTLGVTIGVYGSGNPPKIIATDIATGWTQHDAATYPNVWHLPNWISELVNSNYRLTVYEDEIELLNVASLATCNSTAGTTFITTTPDGDDILYIHPSDSGDPTSNGKTYEASKRISCIYGDTSGGVNTALTVNGPVECLRPPWVSGGIVGSLNTTVKKALVRDGARGMFLTSGSVEDVVFSGLSYRTNSGTSNMLVFFTATAGTYPGTVTRCGFIGGDNPDQTTYEDASGIFSHNDQAGVTHECSTEQCWWVDIVSMGGFRGEQIEHLAPYVEDAGALNLEASTNPAVPPVKYGMFNGGISTSAFSSWDAVHAFEHCVSYDHKNLRTGDGFSLDHCVFFKSGSQNAVTQPIGAGVPNLSINNSICITSGWVYAVDMSGLTSYTGDYNIFASFFTGRQARFRYNGVENSTAGATQYKLKWWQDQTGQDANSVYILPADQTIGGANALFLGWAEASSGTLADHGPAVGDFRINPSARVYSGLDVAYIGTFPDATPLLANVGPQFHWDWNRRGLASGPPTSWPTVPKTDAQGETYLANPAGWNFYP